MSLLKCLTLLALVAVLDAARFKCDYHLYKDVGGYLKFQEMPLTFDAAKQKCASEGGILASPINDAMQATMMRIMKTRKVNFQEIVERTAVFTGISRKSNINGVFSSVEGIRLSEIPHTWDFGEPDNENNEENCIAMLSDGSMADVKCDTPLPHICFLKKMRAETLNVCRPQHKDYTLDATTGSCYKFHSTKLDYDEAARACEREGGHLLIINGDTEAEAVNKLFFDNNKVSNYVFIGFRYDKDLGEWMTLQGETIKEAGFEKWAKGEPNNFRKDQFCGSLDYIDDAHLMNDESCRNKLNFICEKDPEILLCK